MADRFDLNVLSILLSLRVVEDLSPEKLEEGGVLVGCSKCDTLDETAAWLAHLIESRGGNPRFKKVAVPGGVLCLFMNEPSTKTLLLAGIQAMLHAHELERILIVADMECEHIPRSSAVEQINRIVSARRRFSDLYDGKKILVRINTLSPKTDSPRTRHFHSSIWTAAISRSSLIRP